MAKKKNNLNRTVFNKQKPAFNKNSYVGRTYRVFDNDLPHKNVGSGKIVDFAIIEENGRKLGGVRTTTKKTLNTKSFTPKHHLYKGYKTFLETSFNNGDFIVPDDDRLKENPWKNNLSLEQIDNVRSELYNHSKQSSENRRKCNELKSNIYKKSRH